MSHDLVTTAAPSGATRATAPSWLQGAVLNTFAPMRRGRLRLELPDGTVREFGAAEAAAPTSAAGISASAYLKVLRPAFFTKCAFYGDIGFAESYIDGDWETPDLTALIGWFI